MSYELILHNVAKHITLTEKEQEYFITMLLQRKVKKKEFLLQEGQVCRYSIFVVSGCLRGYTLDANGFEHILQFAPPDWWLADMYSFITQNPGELYIDALEHSEVLLLSKEARDQLFDEIPKFERFFRILYEKSLVAYRRRVMDNLSLSAMERFAYFCERYPGLIERVPQKQVAAYIGVTPEFLSKLKAEYFRRK